MRPTTRRTLEASMRYPQRTTRDARARQLPTVPSHAVPTRECQCDPPSLPQAIRCSRKTRKPTDRAPPPLDLLLHVRRSVGHVIDDQHRRLVDVGRANADDTERPAGASGIVSPGFHCGATVVNCDGAAGVPSMVTSLKVNAIRPPLSAGAGRRAEDIATEATASRWPPKTCPKSSTHHIGPFCSPHGPVSAPPAARKKEKRKKAKGPALRGLSSSGGGICTHFPDPFAYHLTEVRHLDSPRI
jgi:hypothetical protein